MEKKLFGTLENGEKVFAYTIENGNLKAEILDYGCIIRKLFYKDRDIVLGFEHLESYVATTSGMGAAIVPSANRIANACFMMDGQLYQMEVNEGKNNLHSHSSKGGHKRLWRLEKHTLNSLVFSLTYGDMELGLPGNRSITVSYTLTDRDELQIDYQLISDKKTLFNPTNHSYFNLNGEGTVNDHLLKLNCDYFTPSYPDNIPTGEVRSVENTPFDFREMAVISSQMDMNDEQIRNGHGYDHNILIRDYDGTLKHLATLKGNITGITLDCYTTQPGVQLYGGYYLDEEDGKYGVSYHGYEGICLETQFTPNAVNNEKAVSPFAEKAQYRTVFRFS